MSETIAMLTSKKMPASRFTNELSNAGGGKMASGLECITSYKYNEGFENGVKKGFITGVLGTTVVGLLLSSGAVFVKKFKDKKDNKEECDKNNLYDI